MKRRNQPIDQWFFLRRKEEKRKRQKEHLVIYEYKAGEMKVHSIFQTIQGEGSKTGTPAVFIRFSGCNLWSGKEQARITGKGGCSLWCDTEFATGTVMTAEEIFSAVNVMTEGWVHRFLVFSGGEPMLQLRKKEGITLIRRLLEHGFHVALETNGTIQGEVIDLLAEHPAGHITVSPKALKNSNTLDHILIRTGTDLKLIYPNDWETLPIKQFESWNFDNFYLQPRDTQDPVINNTITEQTISIAKETGWRISVQTHKLLGLP